MKKIFIVILALVVLLTACSQKQTEAPVVETPEAPAEPAAPVEEPVAETPAEQPKAEEKPAEVPKAQTDEMTYEVAIGDQVTYKDTTFTIDNMANSGNELYLNFNAFILKLAGLNKQEILNSVEYKIASNENFMKAHTVALNVKPLKLEKEQYLIMNGETVTVNNTKLTLGEVREESNGQFSAYFQSNEKTYWLKLKDTIDTSKLKVTLDRAFRQQRQYAVFTIVPK